MGAGPISTRVNNTAITEEWFDEYLAALAGDLVPRDIAAVPVDISVDLGNDTFPWSRINIAAGGHRAGDVKRHLTYGGALGPGHGWMLMDGRIVGKSSYDAEHGAGSWDLYIGSSPLEGKYLPNLVGHYAEGSSATTQDGSAAPTPTGNAAHMISLAHTHRWYDAQAISVTDTSSDSFGDPVSIAQVGGATGRTLLALLNASLAYSSADFYGALAFSTPTSIQPDSFEAQFYMRVI